MDCMNNCLSATRDTLGACFTGMGSGLGNASDCISSSCITMSSAIGSGCSAMGRGLSDCCGSFTTCITGFVTGPLWSCVQSMASAVSNFFSNGFAWIKANPGRVIDISIGCIIGITTAALSVLCFNKFCKSEDATHSTRMKLSEKELKRVSTQQSNPKLEIEPPISGISTLSKDSA